MFRRQEPSAIYHRTRIGEHSARYTKLQNVQGTSAMFINAWFEWSIGDSMAMCSPVCSIFYHESYIFFIHDVMLYHLFWVVAFIFILPCVDNHNICFLHIPFFFTQNFGFYILVLLFYFFLCVWGGGGKQPYKRPRTPYQTYYTILYILCWDVGPLGCWAIGPVGRLWTFCFQSISQKVLVRLSSTFTQNTSRGSSCVFWGI